MDLFLSFAHSLHSSIKRRPPGFFHFFTEGKAILSLLIVSSTHLKTEKSLMDQVKTHFLTGWTHYSFEQEAIFAPDLMLKLPKHHPRNFPRVEKLHIHWSGKPSQDEEMLRVRTAFFLCTQKCLEVTRAKNDDARFSLRQGMPMGLRGSISLQFLGFLCSSHPSPLRRLSLHQRGQSDSIKSSPLYGAHGGFSDLYSLSQLHLYHEFLGSLPGWEWSLSMNTHRKDEVSLLLSLWKIKL